MLEYLPDIGSRNKWFLPAENLKEGDVVLLIDPDVSRWEWRLRKIEVVYLGEDGLVRVVDVRAGGQVMRRPISGLSYLEGEVG